MTTRLQRWQERVNLGRKTAIPDWLWEEHDARCFYCGATLYRPPKSARADETTIVLTSSQIATRDHRLPRSRGGTNARDNLVLACMRCNYEKGALTTDEYRARTLALFGRPFFGERDTAPRRDWLPVCSVEFARSIVQAQIERQSA